MQRPEKSCCTSGIRFVTNSNFAFQLIQQLTNTQTCTRAGWIAWQQFRGLVFGIEFVNGIEMESRATIPGKLLSGVLSRRKKIRCESSINRYTDTTTTCKDTYTTHTCRCSVRKHICRYKYEATWRRMPFAYYAYPAASSTDFQEALEKCKWKFRIAAHSQIHLVMR